MLARILFKRITGHLVDDVFSETQYCITKNNGTTDMTFSIRQVLTSKFTLHGFHMSSKLGRAVFFLAIHVGVIHGLSDHCIYFMTT